VVDHNKISFVPKTAKTDRSIAVEPMLNGMFQKGIDTVLKRKLRAVGLDLRHQERNRELAREGSLDDSEDGFVTIDLASASDSLSLRVTERLVPPDWFELLNRVRSKKYMLPNGETKVFSKICSMGNGFCFPLETLVFASVCIAAGCGIPNVDFRVYGDDIIVRKKYAPKVLSLLKHIGFKANKDKTFLEGPFRESCGADWFGGKDVRPFTLDFALDSVQERIKFLNLVASKESLQRFFVGIRQIVSDSIPSDFRFYRPLWGDDSGAITSTGDEHLSNPHCQFLRKTGIWSWKEFSSESVVDHDAYTLGVSSSLLMVVALRGSGSIKFGPLQGLPEVTKRGLTRTRIVRKSYSATSNWLPT